MPDYNLLLKMFSLLPFKDLDSVIVGVTCTSEECGWAEQLTGGQGPRNPPATSTKAGA
jgi:hypothetical protein